MRICLISGFEGRPDEGMKNFVYNIAKEISDRHKVIHLNLRKNIFSVNFWKEIREFDPQIIHIFLRPNLLTLNIAKFFRLYFSSNTKLVMTSLQPPINYRYIKIISSLFKPDLILVQSYETENLFRRLGYRTAFLPSGVDTTKFTPVSSITKEKLREKYNISNDKFVILHVGHINKGRNLEVFKYIAARNKDVEVIIVGSTNEFNFDRNTYYELKRSGCIVLRKYLKNIEEIYQLSDCYVFPTISTSHAIEIPLSIMEAMACNLPVVSTKFGGLSRIFKEGYGFMFVNNDINNINDKLELIRDGNLKIRTRKQVLPYSWSCVASYLENIYQLSKISINGW